MASSSTHAYHEAWMVDLGAVDTERGVNRYQVQFKKLFKLILKPFNYIQ
jgi:hypothetical protein